MAMKALQAMKGTKDVLPQDSYRWQHLEAIARECAHKAGFREIRTPVFERTELFQRGVGDSTDVVQKEMYTFDDKGGRSITLKPEGTAGTVRALIESGLVADAMPLKAYYLNCPVFRYENPQAGRLREHHQFGIEAFGSASPIMDVDVMSIAESFFREVGFENLSFNINSIGCPKCRPGYQEVLKDYFRPHLSGMCGTCRERFDRNPLRLLDCKEEGCKALVKDAPMGLDYLCEECDAHFGELKSLLDSLGYSFKVDPGIVRGLDYYTKTVFEVITLVDGRPMAVCAGGRYDLLVKTLGGPDLPGVGFGMGFERVLILAQEQGIEFPRPDQYDVLICTIGDEPRKKAVQLVHALRGRGISADADSMGRSLKAQLKYAGKIGAPHVLIIGDDELKTGRYKLRDMCAGTESEASDDELFSLLASK
ncbi:MAG: histidine--tRNA ligase [Christensenellales bacterium]|jgi:histidyl-tRNA synthetase